MLVDVLESKNNILKFRQKLMTQPHRFSFYSADDDSLKFMAVQQQGQIVGVLAFKINRIMILIIWSCPIVRYYPLIVARVLGQPSCGS